MKICPFCQDDVPDDAEVCPYCRRSFAARGSTPGARSPGTRGEGNGCLILIVLAGTTLIAFGYVLLRAYS